MKTKWINYKDEKPKNDENIITINDYNEVISGNFCLYDSGIDKGRCSNSEDGWYFDKWLPIEKFFEHFEKYEG